MAERAKINVAVIFGGRSVEHEVSIISAQQAMLALSREKYRVIPIYISKQGGWLSGDALLTLENFRDPAGLSQKAMPVALSLDYGEQLLREKRWRGGIKKPWQERIDVALPVAHGAGLEDGCIQGVLELAGIPYAGPDVLAAACGMDKIILKAVLAAAGLPQTPYIAVSACRLQESGEETIAEIEAKLPYPLIVKPANLGSSIGVSRAANRDELLNAMDLAFSFSRRLIVELAVEPLREINCAVLGDEHERAVSLCEEPLSAAEILTFADKYLGNGKGMSGAKRRLPADLPPATAEKIRGMAEAAFIACNLSGVCRADFLMNAESGEIYINELNTIPGSLSFYLFEPSGTAFPALLDRLIETALTRKREQECLHTVYVSNILESSGLKGKK